MERNTWITRRSVLKTGAATTGLAGVGTQIGTAQGDESSPDDNCYYQIDFVAGDPIETLGTSEGAFYGKQNRLIQYIHINGGEIYERDRWLNSLDQETRRCVRADPIEVTDGTASVEFTVADGCEGTFSLAVYPLPGGEFSFEEQQELVAMATDTFGPGTHELTVEIGLGSGCPQASNGYKQLAKLTASDTDEGDFFGRSVAVSDPGDTVVVGAYGITEAGVPGSAYVFGREDGGWTQRADLTPDDVTQHDYFGISVAVSGSGDTAVVSADGDDDAGEESGVAYVFGRIDGTWAQRAKLTAADLAPDDGSGPSVGVSDSGDTVVVGAFSYDRTGSAYVFDRADGTWTQRAKLTAAEAEARNWFGSSVGISGSGDTAIVGAPYGDRAGVRVGAAYVFDRTDGTWTQRAKLTTAEAESGDRFGSSVGISNSGDTTVVGAYGDIEAGEEFGSAYVFGREDDGWSQRAKLTTDNVTPDVWYGSSAEVSSSGDTAVVSAYSENAVGSASVFGRGDDGWTQRTNLTPDDGAEGDAFGGSIAVSDSGDTIVIGAPSDDDLGDDAGSAYVFGR